MSVTGRGLEWSDELESRLRELAEEGLTGYKIASELSAQLGVPISADAVYVKASRLGVSLMGRSSSYEITQEDPFKCPSWLRRELKDIGELDKQPRPTRVVWLGLDEQISDAELQKRVQAAREGLWHDYVSDVVRQGLASDKQAEQALKRVSSWFRKWSQVHVIECWNPDDERIQKYEKSLANGVSVADVKRGLEIEELLEEGREFMGASKDDEAVHTEQGDDEGVSLADITSDGDPSRETASRLAHGSPPKEKCARCGGKPTFDRILEEWICSNCGHILRFDP